MKFQNLIFCSHFFHNYYFISIIEQSVFYSRSSVWNLVVLLPLLGITWVFGVFSVNEHTILFQYIFAVANAFQVGKVMRMKVILGVVKQNGFNVKQNRFSIYFASSSFKTTNVLNFRGYLYSASIVHLTRE